MQQQINNKKGITKEEILSRLTYDSETGYFYHNKTKERAGTIRADGYRQLHISGIHYFEHRVAFFLIHDYFPEEVDHINHIKDDNSIKNLRAATKAENQQNRRGSQPNNKSGSKVPGVFWKKETKRYVVRLNIDNKQRQFGSFKSLEEAETKCLELRREIYKFNTI